MKHTDMPAAQMAAEAMRVAAAICIYTNDNITVETL
jgi:ATP-dependent HslUV protease, peptidase subunit HslV